MGTLGVFRDDFYNAGAVLTFAQYTAITQNGGVLVASAIAGALKNHINASGQTGAQAITTDTAANIIARLRSAVLTALITNGMVGAGVQGNPPHGVPNLINLTFEVTIANANTSAGAITLSGGTGVTIPTQSPTAIAVATTRSYMATVTGPAAITLQQISLT